MFNPSREEVRQFFCQAWSRARQGGVLTPLEHIAVAWMREHPEYHALLDDETRALTEEYTPERGETNPFLHLSMHLSIAEQISIDQPPGIRAASEALARRLDSEHEAHHRIMECLGQTLWQAQRTGQPPDNEAYLDSIRRAAR